MAQRAGVQPAVRKGRLQRHLPARTGGAAGTGPGCRRLLPRPRSGPTRWDRFAPSSASPVPGTGPNGPGWRSRPTTHPRSGRHPGLLRSGHQPLDDGDGPRAAPPPGDGGQAGPHRRRAHSRGQGPRRPRHRAGGAPTWGPAVVTTEFILPWDRQDAHRLRSRGQRGERGRQPTIETRARDGRPRSRRYRSHRPLERCRGHHGLEARTKAAIGQFAHGATSRIPPGGVTCGGGPAVLGRRLRGWQLPAGADDGSSRPHTPATRRW